MTCPKCSKEITFEPCIFCGGPANVAKCPDCKGVVSREAKTCPHCGKPVALSASRKLEAFADTTQQIGYALLALTASIVLGLVVLAFL